jgi:hypothetical protein
MKNLHRIFAAAIMGSALSFACTSSTSGANGDGGASSGSGSSSGGGSVSGEGACVLYVDDAGNPADGGMAGGCFITSENGNNISGPPCSTGLTYAASCPTTSLEGCCTTAANSAKQDTVLIDQCYYTDLGIPAAQLQATCVGPVGDGGQGGTWSLTP